MKATFVAAILFCIIPFSSYSAEEPSQVSHNNPVQIKEKINLNTAELNVLVQSIKGIGVKRAQAIIAYREQNGNFKSIEDLAKVHGIGKKFVSKNLSQLKDTFSIE